jgi:hypothetical protein
MKLAEVHQTIKNTHSICPQYINEKHYSLDQVQMMTDYVRRESVKKYALVQLEEKRRLLEGRT